MDRAEKARNLRYKRGALEIMQRDTIVDEIWSISEECSELEWAIDDDETMIDVFDGNTDEIYEYRMMFNDLSANCERLIDNIRDNYVTEHFDDFFVGLLGKTHNIVGYDTFEVDYYHLTQFEAELAQGVSGKRLMALTKSEMISIAGQCISIMMLFLDIRHTYDCLKTAFDALRDDRAELLKGVRSVEEAYTAYIKEIEENPYSCKSEQKYDNLLSRLPARVWIE